MNCKITNNIPRRMSSYITTSKINTAICFENKCPRNHYWPGDKEYEECKCPRLHIDAENFKDWIKVAISDGHKRKPICCYFYLIDSCTRGDECDFGHYPVKEKSTHDFHMRVNVRSLQPEPLTDSRPKSPHFFNTYYKDW